MTGDSAKNRILVIEDDPAVRLLLRCQLETAGYLITEASNGRVGLTLVQQEHPDVVITDLYMPEHDGIEVLRALRSSVPHVKVIAMTGGSVQDPSGAMVTPTAQHLGADRILLKPFDQQTLLKTIKDLLQINERRRFPRFEVEYTMAFFREGTLLGNGIGYDLSAGGGAVETQVSVWKGDYVALRLDLPDQQDATTPLMVELAAVRWRVQQKCGLEFIKLTSTDHQRLCRYVDTFQPTKV